MRNDDLLGYMARDKLTGFRGRITAIVEYISGCVQVCISPSIKDDGTERPSTFFDVQRVEVDKDVDRIQLSNAATPGFERGTIGRRELP